MSQAVAVAGSLFLAFVWTKPAQTGQRSVAEKVRRGCWNKACEWTMKKSGRMRRLMVFRAVQVWTFAFTVLGWFVLVRPEVSAPVLLIFRVLPQIVLFGRDKFKDPVSLLTPPQLGLSGMQVLDWYNKLALFFSLIDTCILCFLGADIAHKVYLGLNVSHVGHAYYYYTWSPGLTVLVYLDRTGLLNVSCISAWEAGGARMLLLGGFIAAALCVAMVVYTAQCLYLLCRQGTSEEEALALHQQVQDASQGIQYVVERRLNDEHGETLLDECSAHADNAEFEGAGPGVLRHPRLPEGIELDTVVHCCIPKQCLPEWVRSIGFRFSYTPGGFLKAFIIVTADLGTDLWSIYKFVTEGHYFFAGALGLFIYTSTLLEIRHGLWWRSCAAFKESRKAGVATEDWLDLHDMERGWETLPAFLLQLYGIPFMGLRTNSEYFLVVVSMLISIYGLVQYLIEKYDYTTQTVPNE